MQELEGFFFNEKKNREPGSAKKKESKQGGEYESRKILEMKMKWNGFGAKHE